MKRLPLLGAIACALSPVMAAEKAVPVEPHAPTPLELREARQKLADARERLTKLHAERRATLVASLAKDPTARTAEEKMLVAPRPVQLPEDPIRADAKVPKR